MKRSLRKKYNFYYFNRSKVFSDVLNYARTTRFFSPNKEISKCSGSVWSKSSISQKIVPRNHNSKSLEVKQFINVRSGPGVACGTIAWSKLMDLGVLLAFYWQFLSECFHTLKIESDFYSRQGHWPLCRTGPYHGILLKGKQRRSSFYFLTKTIKFTLNSISK